MPEEAEDTGPGDQKILWSFDLPGVEAPRSNIPQPTPGPGGWELLTDPVTRTSRFPEGGAPGAGGYGAGESQNQGGSSGGGGGGTSGGGGPGPARKGGVTGGGTSAPAHSIFDPYSGPQVDAAKSLITNFMGWLGYPQSVDTNQMALWVLSHGLENRAGDAYEQLFNSSFLTDEVRNGNPWARYGMDSDTFRVNLSSAQLTLKQLTGMDVSMVSVGTSDALQQLLQNAVKNGWGQTQLMSVLQSGEFTNLAGNKATLGGLNDTMPWIASGQTYQSTQQQFTNIYGVPPADSNQLGAWFRFNQSSSRLQTTQREAVQGAVDVKAVGTAVR